MARRKKSSPKLEIDLAAALGAEESVSTQCFSVYIPNKDKNGAEIGNQRKWVLEAIQLLSDINEGATAMPQVEGAWKGDDGKLIWENPIVVYSFIRAKPFAKHLDDIRKFLHRMGRETNQGEIAFDFDGQFHRIREFDPKPE